MRILIVLLAALLTGCGAYRIAAKDDSELIAALKHEGLDTEIQVIKQNKFPEGFQCFEPMLYVLTLGVIPVHCVDTYKATITPQPDQEPVTGIYTTTIIGGWFALLLAPLPGWHYTPAYQEITEAEIEAFARSRSRKWREKRG